MQDYIVLFFECLAFFVMQFAQPRGSNVVGKV